MLKERVVGCDLRTRYSIFALLDDGDAVRCVVCGCMVTYRLADSGHIHSNRCGCGPRGRPANDAS